MLLERALTAAPPKTATGLRAGAVIFITALTAAAAQVSMPLPFTPIPFTLQPMIVLLGGAALGSRLGATAQLLYLFAGIAGLPVFAAAPHLPQGLPRVLGPSGGYLMSYPIAAFVTGWLAERGWDRRYGSAAAAMTAGLAMIFSCGVAWLALVSGSARGAVASGLTPFIVADLLKVLLAAAVLPTVWRLIGHARGPG